MYTRPYELYISLDELKAAWHPETDWVNEKIIRAGGMALEFTFLLCQSLAQDERKALYRDARKQKLFKCLAEQVNLLASLLTPIPLPDSIAAQDPTDTNLTGIPTLDLSWQHDLQGWAALYHALLDRFPFDIGIDQSVQSLLPGKGASSASNTRPRVPYTRWVNPAALKAIYHRRDFNAEDPYFCTVHQITECWFVLVLDLLDRAFGYAAHRAYPLAAKQMLLANNILDYLNGHVMLLESMVLADYHKLRVQLRDASGAQSRQAYEVIGKAQRLAGMLEQYTAGVGLQLYHIQRNPEHHTDVYHFVEALGSLGNHISTFFFRHYKLASRVLGIESLGSLGYEVQALVNRFAQPFFSALDEASYMHAVVTNFQYGEEAGRLVSQMETADGMPNLNALEYERPEPQVEVDPRLINKQIKRYFKAVRETNLDDWIRLFEPDGWIVDPSGCRPYTGHHGLRIFFRNFVKVFSNELTLVVSEKEVDAQTATARVQWTVQAVHKDIPISFSGNELFQFNPNGRIRFVRVFHKPVEIAKQFEKGLRVSAREARSA